MNDIDTNNLTDNNIKHLAIFDLDQTLVAANYEDSDGGHDFRLMSYNGGYYYIYIRPGFETMVDTISDEYDIGVWSAGSPYYVSQVVDNIFCNLKNPIFTFDSRKCIKINQIPQDYVSYNKPVIIKPLRKVWNRYKNIYTRYNTVIIDDNPNTYIRNYGNAIGIPDFYGDSSDILLLKITNLLRNIKHYSDVREGLCIHNGAIITYL